jgi:predicted GH43/DUF377 family glycosyl hydrolase
MFSMVSIFTASFAQLPWTKDTLNNPVLSGGEIGTWNRHVFQPSVLYNSDSVRYEMWFGAYNGSLPYRIGFAVSDDGINWEMQQPNAVLEPSSGTWDESSVGQHMVLRENGQYKMWYTGRNLNAGTGGIGYATSPDGVNWTKDTLHNPVLQAGTDLWEAGARILPYVIPVQGGTYKMWYTGLNAVFTEANIGYATSGDGIAWTTADSVNPVLTTGTSGRWDDAWIFEPKVLFIDNEYHMWYSGERAGGDPRQIGWATSVDGIHWNKYDDTTTTSTLYADSDPVLKPSPGQWDGNTINAGPVMLEGESLRMWYAGSRSPSGTYLWRIGHASTLLITGIFEIEDIFVPGDYVLRQNYPNPFNPTTKIRYEIPELSFVTVKVYDVLGSEVAILVNEEKPIGSYEVEFNAASLPSGIYFYRLQAGSPSTNSGQDFVETKKMVLLK